MESLTDVAQGLSWIINAKVVTRLIKWAFTWLLALLPIIFMVFRRFLDGDDIQLITICSTGELFLVCIVMAAEPLGDVIVAGKRSILLFLIAVCSIMFIATSTYIFSIVNSDEQHNIMYKTTLYQCEYGHCTPDSTTASSLSKPDSLKHLTDCETKRGVTSKIEIKGGRLKILSVLFFCVSFAIGFFSVCLANFEDRVSGAKKELVV